jgi:hypothetical protein
MPRTLIKYSVVLTAMLLFVAAKSLFALEGTEYQIKGAMMINFIKFVQWPESQTGPSDTTITIGIIGAENFGNSLDRIEGRNIEGKKLSIRQIHSLKQLSGCQVLFISASESRRSYQTLREVAGMPVLTIGEDEDFIRLGGIIRLFNEKDHIRFEINQSAAQHANLKLSAKLLEVAAVVH